MIKTVFEAGLSLPMYYVFHILGYLCVLFFNIWFGEKYNIKRWQSILTTFVVYGITYIWIYIQYWIESGFTDFGGNNMVRGFVYIPLIALPVACILKIKWKNMCDFIAPCVCISFGISHIGCIFVGCCKGFPNSWGIYHPYEKITLFPVQLFEAATALIIVLLLVYRVKKISYRSDGLSFPIMLLCYGSTRFFWEFARNNRKILWGCSSLAFHALFMALVGGVAIMCICLLRSRRANTSNVKRRTK